MARKTLQDVSRETGFAVSTISGVLNNRADCFASESTRKRIREAAERLGYRPNYFAQALRSQESRIIGIAGLFSSSEPQGFQCRGIQNALRERGYVAVLSDMTDGVQRPLRDFEAIHADGVIAFYDRDDLEVIRKDMPHLPLLVVGSRALPEICSIIVDRKTAMKALTRHLIKLGHRQILFLTRKLVQNRSKFEGYVEAMKGADLGANVQCLESPDMLMGSRDVVADNLETFRTVTAVVTTGDQVAVEVMSGLRQAGMSVPADISVAGFSDNWIAKASTPALTTVRLPRAEIGEIAVPMLIDIIAGKNVPNRRIVPAVVERDSCAPPPVRGQRPSVAKEVSPL